MNTNNIVISTSELLDILNGKSNNYSTVLEKYNVGHVSGYDVHELYVNARSSGNCYKIDYLYNEQLGVDDRCDQWVGERALILPYVQFVNILINDNDKRYRIARTDVIVEWKRQYPLCAVIVEDSVENVYYKFEYERYKDRPAHSAAEFIGTRVTAHQGTVFC